MNSDKTELLKQEYISLNKSIDAFGLELSKQIEQIFNENNVSLGFPIQYRTKSWISAQRKIKNLPIKSIVEMQDLCGLRFVLLFKRDIQKVRTLIANHFSIQREYDTNERLDSDQFGYSSLHMVIKMPDDWFNIPTLKGFRGLKAEVQIRTLAQHTWAAASHTLQYKSEENVPKTMLRSIYRVSAILETVDIEFERFLEERESYLKQLNTLSTDQINKIKLNVNSLEKILDENLPFQNKGDNEEYSELIDELRLFEIFFANELIELIKKHKQNILLADKNAAVGEKDYYFTHTGLLRCCFELEDPMKWEILVEKWNRDA